VFLRYPIAEIKKVEIIFIICYNICNRIVSTNKVFIILP